MIAKQQALDFIYELSQNFIISFDVTNNSYSYLNISSPNDFETIGVEDKLNSLEVLVTKLIKEYMEVFIPYIDKIPVDIDILEVGQAYQIELDDWYDGCHTVHIFKYTGRKEQYYCFEDEHKNTWKYEAKDFYQLWRVK